MIFNNQAGQAMVEYVLVLIISVTLLFLAKGVFSSLNNFMTSYVGGYFKCLLVQGELPKLGVEDPDLSKHTSAGYKCSVTYKSDPIAGGSSTGGTKNVGTSKPISTNKGSTKDTASRRGSKAVTTAGKSKFKKSNRAGASADTDDARFSSSIQNRSDAYSTSDSDEYESSIQSVSMSRGYKDEKPEKYRAITGEQADNILKRTRGGRGQERSKLAKKIPLDEELRPGPRRNKLNPPIRAVAAISDDVQEPMTFGYFLKWIVIAAIVIALVVFFGGQVLNYSKSSDN